ncbi:MAG: asparagine synthase (glutamine-hydrolyzing) [Candidatus Lokiarchaeota archaeon]
MCGIIGVFANEDIDLNKFIEMRDELKHRGPDDEGVYLNQSGNIALGHRRLSIIDLSPNGKQPMSNEDKTIWITFNGEIYNYQKLKDYLIKQGHKFKTNTDTEVIIHGYEEWEYDVLNKINGMFAFGILDENKNELFLARDRLGIKPLYYYFKNKKLIFASEVKGIIKDTEIKRIINLKALKYYFLFGYIPNPYSIWEDIYKLPPGKYLLFKNGKISIKKYWDINNNSIYKNEKSIIKKIKKLFSSSIKYRLISDVPVGVLLSGGLDSSLVSAFTARIKKEIITFSIGFKPENISELNDAKFIANYLGVKNVNNILSKNNIDKFLDKLLYFYDEPFGISSIEINSFSF